MRKKGMQALGYICRSMIGDSELEFEEKLLMNACTALQLSKVIDRLSTFSFQIFPQISE